MTDINNSSLTLKLPFEPPMASKKGESLQKAEVKTAPWKK
jgi:hypothetical protein